MLFEKSQFIATVQAWKDGKVMIHDVCDEAEKWVNSQYDGKPIVRRSFHLSEIEAETFAKSGSKKLMFDFDGGGVGVRVWYADEQGKWVEITDYSTW